jgi:hypothetical protein
MLRRRSTFAVCACGALLAACGSTSHTRNAVAINAALRRLQAELEKPPPAKLGGKDVLGHITLVYAPPPKGVSAVEWQTAIGKDRAVQRLITSQSK